MRDKIIDELTKLFNEYNDVYIDTKERYWYYEGFVDGIDLAIQIVEGVFDEEC